MLYPVIFRLNFLQACRFLLLYFSIRTRWRFSDGSLPSLIFYYSTIFLRTREILFKYFENNVLSRNRNLHLREILSIYNISRITIPFDAKKYIRC